jgi:hypothetical protein
MRVLYLKEKKASCAREKISIPAQNTLVYRSKQLKENSLEYYVGQAKHHGWCY